MFPRFVTAVATRKDPRTFISLPPCCILDRQHHTFASCPFPFYSPRTTRSPSTRPRSVHGNINVLNPYCPLSLAVVLLIYDFPLLLGFCTSVLLHATSFHLLLLPHRVPFILTHILWFPRLQFVCLLLFRTDTLSLHLVSMYISWFGTCLINSEPFPLRFLFLFGCHRFSFLFPIIRRWR